MRLIANENDNNEAGNLVKKHNVCTKKIEEIKKCSSKIGNVTFQKSVVKFLEGIYLNEKASFDTIWYYIGFDDGVLNIKTNEFRSYEAEDYMTKSVGYNYSDVCTADTETLWQLINQIHPDEESRDCWLSIVCTALEGKTLEKFTVFNGRGRNGKGLLDEILLEALGKRENDGYATTLNSSVLCAPIIKDGPNPEVAKLDKIRLVIASEFPAGSMINNAVVKQLTGGSNMEARYCHSNKTEVNLQCTLIIECNDKPPFREKVGDAEFERLIDLAFPCIFTENKDRIDPREKYLSS